jgi:hypothetical protein
MASLLSPDPIPVTPSVDMQLRHLVICLRSDHPDLTSTEFYDLFLDKADDVVTQILYGEPGNGRAFQQLTGIDA